ncbi:hypothetical protein YC2023_084167 [Brassica napus]
MSLTLKLLFLVLLLFVSSHHVDSGSIVKFLPGFEGPLPFELETGYIGIGEEEDIQLFYYIKSENNPIEDPLLIWLNGGPGCSSLLGLLFEKVRGLQWKSRFLGLYNIFMDTCNDGKYVANILFLDQPVGSGFSYSRTPLDKTSDTNEVKMIHEFLQKCLLKALVCLVIGGRSGNNYESGQILLTTKELRLKFVTLANRKKNLASLSFFLCSLSRIFHRGEVEEKKRCAGSFPATHRPWLGPFRRSIFSRWSAGFWIWSPRFLLRRRTSGSGFSGYGLIRPDLSLRRCIYLGERPAFASGALTFFSGVGRPAFVSVSRSSLVVMAAFYRVFPIMV